MPPKKCYWAYPTNLIIRLRLWPVLKASSSPGQLGWLTARLRVLAGLITSAALIQALAVR